MASWQILEQRKYRTLLCSIAYGGARVSLEFTKMYKNLQLPAGSDTIVVENLPYGPARNHCAATVLQGGYSYLAFLDCDILLPPDAYIKLIETGHPIISALYYQKFPPYNPAFFGAATDEQGQLVKTAIPFTPGQIVDCVFMPAGCCIIHRSVFERMQQAGITRFYEWGMDIDTPQGISEDYSFSLKAANLGIQPRVHTGIIARHEITGTVEIETQGIIKPSLL